MEFGRVQLEQLLATYTHSTLAAVAADASGRVRTDAGTGPAEQDAA